MTRVLLLVAGMLLALSSPVLAAEPRTNLADLEDEVMCPICGTLLELAEAPQADRQRAFISELIAGGRTKQQIKDELVAEYGPRVLALPRGSGFELSAYLVPAIAFAVGTLALALGISRWRRRPGSPDGGRRPPPSDEDAQRLEADLARYDL
jgi:cytochrome c-type biogenesis protein CcmH